METNVSPSIPNYVPSKVCFLEQKQQ